MSVSLLESKLLNQLPQTLQHNYYKLGKHRFMIGEGEGVNILKTIPRNFNNSFYFFETGPNDPYIFWVRNIP